MPVYFIQAGEGGPIKIGHGKNPRKRLTMLQSGNPMTLTLLAELPGGKEEEQEMHTRLREYRVRGEWFTPAAEVLALVPEPERDPPKIVQAAEENYLKPSMIRGATKAIAERLGLSEATVSLWRLRGIPDKHAETVRAVIAELVAPKDAA